jgi:hypothetical protein
MAQNTFIIHAHPDGYPIGQPAATWHHMMPYLSSLASTTIHTVQLLNMSSTLTLRCAAETQLEEPVGYIVRIYSLFMSCSRNSLATRNTATQGRESGQQVHHSHY